MLSILMKSQARPDNAFRISAFLENLTSVEFSVADSEKAEKKLRLDRKDYAKAHLLRGDVAHKLRKIDETLASISLSG